MKTRTFLLTILAMLITNSSLSCTIARIIPPELTGRSQEEINQYFLGESFQLTSIVAEVTVTSVEDRRGFDLMRIRPETFWKTDGRPVEFTYQEPRALCQQNHLHVGLRYIVFAERRSGMLEYTKLTSTPLIVSDIVLVPPPLNVSSSSEVKEHEAIPLIRTYLAKMSVLPISP